MYRAILGVLSLNPLKNSCKMIINVILINKKFLLRHFFKTLYIVIIVVKMGLDRPTGPEVT
jgi:hypothetical protein